MNLKPSGEAQALIGKEVYIKAKVVRAGLELSLSGGGSRDILDVDIDGAFEIISVPMAVVKEIE